jgi:hypothetical protein
MSTLIALAALLVASQTSQPPAEAVTLRLLSFPKRGAGELKYEGKAVFPDGIALKGTLFRSEERLADGRLGPELAEIASDVATVEGRRIAFTLPVKEPGVYQLVVELREDLQEPDLVPSITKSLPGKWTFCQAVWGDEFAGPLGSKLREFDQQAEGAIALIRRFASATSSSQIWKDHYPTLDKELAGYLKKLDQSGLEKPYAAAVLELRCTMRNLKGNAEAMVFGEDGTCKGSIDYRTQKPTKTIHSEDFAFDAILKDVDLSKRAAGREFLLWIIKDFRLAGARAELSALLHSEAKREGAASSVEALDGFKDVDSAEKQIRER